MQIVLIGQLDNCIGMGAHRRYVEEQLVKSCSAIDPNVRGQDRLIQLARIFECCCLPGPCLVGISKDPIDDR